MALPRIENVKITDCCFDTPILLLGKVGENLATQVVIDATEWQDGSGTYQLLVKRADEEMFTATITQADGVVTWLIPAAEIGAAGYGEIELNYIVGEAKMKSARVDTRVFSSIEIDSLPPNGTTWSQLVLAAISDAREAADDAEAAQQAVTDMIDDAVADATEAAENAAASAEDYAQAASDCADDADESADNAEESATLAESYAKGGTSTRQGEDTDNAKYYKERAESSEENAKEYKNACQTAHDEIFDILNNATILDTTETVTLNADNLVSQIVHTSNETGLVVRTDVFTYTNNNAVVTEVRTAADGRTQTNIYNLETLEQQFNV